MTVRAMMYNLNRMINAISVPWGRAVNRPYPSRASGTYQNSTTRGKSRYETAFMTTVTPIGNPVGTITDTFIAPPCHQQINILYQDEHLLLINKPSGLLSLSGKNPLNKDSVHYRLVQDFPSATMVHRLDFGTSGIMVLALTRAVSGHIGKQFQARTVTKTYTAILHGHLARERGSIALPIAKDKQNFPLQKICYDTGKQALSEYEVVEQYYNPASSRVIFFPQTGRTHQLRIHSLEIGHPILGCDLYGAVVNGCGNIVDAWENVGDNFGKTKSDKNRMHTQTMADRLLLHATTLAFTHPVTGQKMLGHSPCPF